MFEFDSKGRISSIKINGKNYAPEQLGLDKSHRRLAESLVELAGGYKGMYKACYDIANGALDGVNSNVGLSKQDAIDILKSLPWIRKGILKLGDG